MDLAVVLLLGTLILASASFAQRKRWMLKDIRGGSMRFFTRFIRAASPTATTTVSVI
jgi:hypothetical protein